MEDTLIEDYGCWNNCVGKCGAGRYYSVSKKDERGVLGVTLSGTVVLWSTVLGGAWSKLYGGGGGV